MEYIMYAFLAMVLLMLLWALRLWYRMHQEETVKNSFAAGEAHHTEGTRWLSAAVL